MAAVAIEEFNPITIGVDVGQLVDPTAICVAEASEKHTGKWRQLSAGRHIPLHRDPRTGEIIGPYDADPVNETHYTVRYIQRSPLRTSYPDVATIIAEMVCNPRFVHRKVRLLIDVTGVGRPVFEDLRKEIKLRQEAQSVALRPISFVHGEKYNRSAGTVGKGYLVSRLQSLLQRGVVHAPDTAEVKTMLEELRVYEIKVDQDGKDTYGATVGNHDDLATALALACLEDPFSDRVTYSRQVY